MTKKRKLMLLIISLVVLCTGTISYTAYKHFKSIVVLVNGKTSANKYEGTWATEERTSILTVEYKDGKSYISFVNSPDNNSKLTASTEPQAVNISDKGCTKFTIKGDSLNPDTPIKGKISVNNGMILVFIENREGSSQFGIFPGSYAYTKDN